MTAMHDTLLLSSAHQAAPDIQCRREQGLLLRARRGEIHLHVSTLHGQLLSLGRFHPRLPDAGAQIWHRHTGGRAVAAGDGFLNITLALPARTVLGESLRPEQILNRAVRGFLQWLRGLQIDPVYPGLDFITAGSRRLAHLGFVEGEHGELLVQIILAQTTSLAETMLRLDRLDPDGNVPSMVWLPEEATTMDRLGPVAERQRLPNAALGPLGSAYAENLGLGVGVCDTPSLTRDLESTDPEPPPAALSIDNRVQIQGRLGPVLASITILDGQYDSVGVEGDFLAPESFPGALTEALKGEPATSETLQRVLPILFGQPEFYALGMDADLFLELLERARKAAS